MQLNIFNEIFDPILSEIFNSTSFFFSQCKSTEYNEFQGDNIFANPQFKNVLLYFLIFIFFNIQLISYLIEYYHNNIENIRNLQLDVAGEPNQENREEEWKPYGWKLIGGNDRIQNNSGTREIRTIPGK